MSNTLKIKTLPNNDFAFVYVHRKNGAIRVESLDTAKHVDGSPEWKHVSTLNPYVCLENILTASTRQRAQYIKDLLK
jgi:hypothetical protein